MWRVKEQINCTERVQRKYSGKNISVAVLDTGIFLHPDFSGRILAFRDFISGNETPYDDSGHGTHVAGCLAGDGYLSEGRFCGIAPSCNLVIGKVLNQKGNGNIDNIISAIHWILENKDKYTIRILNISISFEEKVSEYKIKKLTDALENVWSKGILVVVAAGNKGPKSKSISPLGMSKNIVTVGCHDLDYHKEGITLCESYSGRGPSIYSLKKPDLVAPGTNIMSTCYQCRRAGKKFVDIYESKSGTSFATPLVSGAAALLLEKRNTLTPEEIKFRLCYSATDLKEPWNKQGWGMLNVERALNCYEF